MQTRNHSLRCGGLKAWVLATVASLAGWVQAQEAAYVPQAVQVSGPVYAIVGPLGQRSAANAGLNANYGFVVTGSGVLLIDSGASAYSASLLEKAVQAVTPEPVRWVLNTGSQDHRWLGNGHFASRGAAIYAMDGTDRTQRQVAEQQLAGLYRFVGEQLRGTTPTHASVVPPGPEVRMVLGGVELLWLQTDAHYPGDTMVHLPHHSVTFTGDLVYVDRLMGVLPASSVRKGQAAFARLKGLAPRAVVPGHGRVTDLAQAQRETGDYYDFLIRHIGEAARNMDPMHETLDKFARPEAFSGLQNFDELHRGNMNRVFVDFENRP